MCWTIEWKLSQQIPASNQFFTNRKGACLDHLDRLQPVRPYIPTADLFSPACYFCLSTDDLVIAALAAQELGEVVASNHAELSC